MKTGEVLAALRARYTAPEWALFTEVGDSTGANVRRHADAVAMNLWPSRGMELHGFEVKVSRADWMREINNPAKSGPVQKFCDRWWVVVGDLNIVAPGELPPTWGLMSLDAGKLKVRTEAPKLEAEPVNRMFVAAILRRVATESPSAEALKAEFERGHTAGEKAGYGHALLDRSREHDELATLKRVVGEFEEAAGVRLNKWSASANKDLGAAMRLALQVGEGERRMAAIRSTAEGLMRALGAEVGAAR